MINAAHLVKIWRQENMVSSDGLAETKELPAVSYEDEKGIYGRLVQVDGPKHGSLQSCGVFQPGRKVTTNCFDKGQLYYSLHGVQTYLSRLGIKTQKILTSNANGPFPIRAHANATSALNAWYSPQSKDLTFGTAGDMSKGEDQWHLASDNDVSVHEFGHLILDHINPMLGKTRYGEGRAIHEGFGDALAALYHNDAEMSEDFAVAMGRTPNKEDGLRNLNNDLTIEQVSTEEHDRGQVYSAFFWSLKKYLSDQNGPFKLSERAAADLCVKILFNHASMYQSSSPKPKDFVFAVLLGIDGLASEDLLGVDINALKSTVTWEAARRKLIKPDDKIDQGEYAESFEEIRHLFSKKTRFQPFHSTSFIGGTREIHQQKYITANGVEVDVVGKGLIVNKDAKGSVLSISLKDVWRPKSGNVDETISIPPSEAMRFAGMDAGKRMNEAQSWMNALYASPPENSFELYQQFEMDKIIAQTALQNLTGPGFGSPKLNLVLIPESGNLHYEIKVGMGIYYVNARTGDVIFKKDVFVN